MSRLGKFLLIAGFGLLPLWVSIAWLLIGASQESVSSEYWNVASAASLSNCAGGIFRPGANP